MALYVEYEDFKIKYLETQSRFAEILSEKEQLFERTQPKATTFDKERVSGGNATDAFTDYLISKQQKRIDERLDEVKSMLEDRERLLKLKETELRKSMIPADRIYTYRMIDRMRIYKIAKKINYSEAQVYRILQDIKRQIMIGNESFSSDKMIMSKNLKGANSNDCSGRTP